MWDVVVTGAGAAGLLAACRAAERGRHVLLLEKNDRPGVKILMSGGTRCNITHATDRRGIVEAFGKQGRFLNSALAALGPDELVALIEAEGVLTKTEPTGKVFPVSNRASDVLQALLQRLERSGATLSAGEPVMAISRRPAGLLIQTPLRELSVPKAIVTTGGQSYPGSGTTGEGYAWAELLGHRVVPRRPALVPITTAAEWVRSLMGVTLSDVQVEVIDGKEIRERRRGGFLFAHFGLSGPAVLNVSRGISGHPRPNTLLLRCDFLPGTSPVSLEGDLKEAARRDGRRPVSTLLSEVLHHASPRTEIPRRLQETLLRLAGVPSDRRGAELSREERLRIVSAIKSQDIPIAGTKGYGKAEVTAGGVSLDEIDSRTMESRLIPGLYFAGEVLDLDGPIGGYNFQAAFSTGWLAGESV